MKVEMDARQVTVFLNSTDQWHGQALYSAIVRRCQEMGIAGATVTRCVEGYGAGRHLHTTRLLSLTEDLPIRIEIIDAPERIDPLLDELDKMIGEGLVVVANVRVRRYLADPKK